VFQHSILGAVWLTWNHIITDIINIIISDLSNLYEMLEVYINASGWLITM
jgi:hypothetical protein